MAKQDLELIALALISVTARMPGAEDAHAYPVLGIDTDFYSLPSDDDDATVDDVITQETVLKLAAAAARAMRLPTKEMRAAGAAILASVPTDADHKKAGEIFRAMIGELLRE